MKKKKRKRIILAICSMFISVLSIFAFIPFNNDKQIVYADEIVGNYSFEGSELIFPSYVFGRYGNDFKYFKSTYMSIKFNFYVRDGYTYIKSYQTARVEPSDMENDYMEWSGSGLFLQNNDFSSTDYTQFVMNNSYQHSYAYLSSYKYSDNTRVYLFADVFTKCSSEFNGNVISVSIGSYLYNPLNDLDEPYYNYVQYLDNNGNSLTFAICYQTTKFVGGFLSASIHALDYRTYYLQLNLTDNEIYRNGFNEGLRDGYLNGQNDGYLDGYDKGYRLGKGDGYNLGYNTAMEKDRYTFDSLLSAVIDVPVRTFTSLFNFDILGVNLSGFFLGLLTCCIVITIVRLLL